MELFNSFLCRNKKAVAVKTLSLAFGLMAISNEPLELGT
jgi:hypothetical protein